jgi:hypothetical protein
MTITPEEGTDADEAPTAMRCRRCGRTIPYTAAELHSSIRGSWPRCCGHGMSLDHGPMPGKSQDATPEDLTIRGPQGRDPGPMGMRSAAVRGGGGMEKPTPYPS